MPGSETVVFITIMRRHVPLLSACSSLADIDHVTRILASHWLIHVPLLCSAKVIVQFHASKSRVDCSLKIVGMADMLLKFENSKEDRHALE